MTTPRPLIAPHPLITPVVFDGAAPGPCLLVLGRIHGNEPSGTIAQEAVIERIRSGRLGIAAGAVLFVPICNPQAAVLDRRFVDVDLNRNFRLVDPPTAYEHRLVHELAPLIDRATHVLDIHSTASETEPFIFVDVEDEATRSFAAGLGVPNLVTGWADVYDGRTDDQDTMVLVRERGAIGLVLETGQHGDRRGPAVAERAICQALETLGLARLERGTGDGGGADKGACSRVFRMDRLERKPGDDAEFVKPLRNFTPVAKGEPLARRPGMAPLLAPFDGVVILPKAHAKTGEEWFYLARPEGAVQGRADSQTARPPLSASA
ncbi:MAG: succinylglutamate desuccinylase/aspartoacylase family protein [Alphaproteobacteria bacterium]